MKPVVKREGPLDQALLIGIAILLGAGIVLWLTGEVAGFLHGHRWARITAADMGPVLVNTARRPGNPAAAWPAPVRRLLPGPVAFWFIFGLLLFVLTASLMYLNVGLRTVRRRLGRAAVLPGPPSARGRPQPAQPSWARPQAFRDLYVREPMPGRVTLGRVNGRVVAAEPLQSVIALGPTQSHKTAGLTVPAVFEWDGPVLAASVKSDLVRNTIDQRWQRGEVYLYDPTGITGLESNSWSPLGRCGAWHGAYRTAVSLLSAGRQNPGAEADLHHSMAPNLLGPLLLAAAISGRTMADVVRWVQRQERSEVTAALNVAGEPAAQDAIQAVWGLGDNRAQLYASVLGAVSAYADPAVKEAVPATQLTAARLLDGGANTAYVCAAAHEQRRLGPLFVALLQEVIDLAYERSGSTGLPLDPPLLVVLDDAAVSAALPQLDMLASTAANHGVQLLTTFRTITQMQSRYGERAEAVFANHRAKILLSGITDPPTLALLSHLLEDETLHQVAPAAPAAPAAADGTAAPARAAKTGASPSEALRRINPGQGVLLYGHLPPAFLTLRPWFRDRRMALRAGNEGKSRIGGVVRRPLA
jgi:type IV secretion system protein VirD4